MLTLGTKLPVEEVPLAALEEQHRSTDPLQKTLAALMMIAYAGVTLILFPTTRPASAKPPPHANSHF